MSGFLVSDYGGPEVMVWTDLEVPAPGSGQVLLAHQAVGLNFIDIYFRTGLYKAPALPFVPGVEGVGIVEAVGEGVRHVAPGDRVAYASNMGAWCQRRLIEAARVVKVPETLDSVAVAAVMLKGLTAHYLLRQTFKVQAGQRILFHAAAGGVGLLAGQWAKALGCTTIGTARGADKARLALEHGYDHVIDYSCEDFVARVREITDGAGVDVAYDSVGKDTYPQTLDCLKPRGMWVSFGQSSGSLPPVNFGIFAEKGSLFATRPTLNSYIATPEALQDSARVLFEALQSGTIEPVVHSVRPLQEAVAAQSELESGQTHGCTVFTLG